MTTHEQTTRESNVMNWWARITTLFYDCVVTLILWIYFTLGFVIFFSPRYLFALCVSSQRELDFQKFNHRFFKSFFFLCKLMVPGLEIHVDPRIETIRSSVIVSNHVSFLDPLLMIYLFERHKTIIKSHFRYVPLFGWFLNLSGYIFESGSDKVPSSTIARIESLGDYLTSGGNLFIFPEGTRNRNGKIGPFETGAFRIAKRCGVPIQVVFIENTDKLFTPGRLLFHSGSKAHIRIQWLGSIYPAKISQMVHQAKDLMEGWKQRG